MSSLLVLGGARSGKSRYAQARAEQSGPKRVFVATGQAFDDEMRDRIARHQADRGTDWETVEAPVDLAQMIAARAAPDTVLLVDCLTLWASNLLLAELDTDAALENLVAAIGSAVGDIILVANEVGLGIVPDNQLARRFRDIAGTINQQVAAVVGEVQFVCAGVSMRLK